MLSFFLRFLCFFFIGQRIKQDRTVIGKNSGIQAYIYKYNMVLCVSWRRPTVEGAAADSKKFLLSS